MNTELKVLVVDDMSTMRKIATKFLKSFGFTDIQEAEDGIPAWELIQEQVKAGAPFQLIVSDWNMPGMTGLDLLKKVRADETMKKVPFIMVTAEGEKENIIAAVQAGVSNYVIKPFTPDTLEGKLKAVLK